LDRLLEGRIRDFEGNLMVWMVQEILRFPFKEVFE
jgi:hypothetical protein